MVREALMVRRAGMARDGLIAGVCGVAAMLAGGCSREPSSAAGGSGTTTGLVAPSSAAGGSAASGGAAGAPLAFKAFYRIDAAPQAPCASGSTCESDLVLTALGGYHVNKDYPFKFVGDPANEAVLDGIGTFALNGEKRGTLTIKFRPDKPGTTKVVGTFKLSVCSDENCEIETPKLELAVPVS
jgi:hypothetical protein